MQENSKRLANNTLVLTIRMLFLMVINLYTSRILLQALGVEDYGIYNVVGGVVTMFSIISSSITAAITRFITFELGNQNEERLAKVFSSSLIIQCILALTILVFLETIGLWFLNSQLNIPDNRVIATNWVFQFSVVTFCVNLISVPYNACIIAHEKMSAFAYISIYEGVSKLLIAYLILMSPIDKLIFYALALCLLSVSVRIIYSYYCKKNFVECTFHWSLDRPLIKMMFGFAGWNFIGAAAGLLRDQGGNIIINIFCGPSVNAARGIAYQVNGAVSSFVSGFTTSMHPQITKSYANGDLHYMNQVIYNGSKFSFFILFVLSLPILLSTDYIVNLWLGQSPIYSVSFIRLILLLTLSESISMPLVTAMLASGNIKQYQIVVGGLNLLNLPISLLFLYLDFSPDFVFITAIIISQLCLFVRLCMLRTMVALNIYHFFKKVFLKILLVSVLASLITLLLVNIQTFFCDGCTKFLFTTFCSLFISLSLVWILGLNSSERKSVNSFIKKITKSKK